MKVYTVKKLLYPQILRRSLSANVFFRMTGMVMVFTLFFYSATNAQNLDVPYVSTPPGVVEKMLDVAHVGSGDYVIDLGCGDGRIVIAAAQRGAFGHGLDLDPERIREAEENARQAGVKDKVMFLQQDIFNADFSRANVITMYLLRSINLKLRPILLDSLEPGTKIVSHNFDMGDWKPDKHIRLDDSGVFPGDRIGDNPGTENNKDFTLENWVVDKPVEIDSSGFKLGNWMVDNRIKLKNLGIDQGGLELNGPLGIKTTDIFYWVVPAQVEGQWQWQSDGKRFVMSVEQKFQEIQLNLHKGNVELHVENSGLTGKRIGFTAINPSNGTRYVYNGRVDGDQIKGNVQIHGNNDKSIEKWSATLK